jgi:hypothetical protein
VAVDALAAAGLSVDAATGRRLLVVALLAVGIGVRSATVRRLAVPEVTTTVVTATITALAADPRAPGATRRLWRLATIAVRLVGALVGALLIRVSLFVPFLLVAVPDRPCGRRLTASPSSNESVAATAGPPGRTPAARERKSR